MTDAPQLSTDAQLQYDELAYLLRSTLAESDADDAIDTLDALLDLYRDQVLAEARDRAPALPTARRRPVTGTPPPAADTDLDERERRLRADFDDARKALQLAQGHLDRIANELRELRRERRDRATARAVLGQDGGQQ
ncbi:hypothetical protein AB0O91_21140 [Kitasatospora sp. NPDC089797]|uniref:hypothetical protein n=1 Tax=Kitasatospora sp. NPDC089797 TaxID=3155298 RepID=UPI0034463B27